MLGLIIWGSVLAYLFYQYAVKPMSYWKERGVKQGNAPWFVGDNFKTLMKTQSFADMVVDVYNRFKNVRYSGIYQFTVPTLLLHDPELVKQITVKDFDHFADHRSFIPEDADPLWGKNLFALTGERWRDMRPILSPSFTSSKMRQIFLLMSDCVDTFVQHFKKDNNKKLVEVEMKDIFTRFGNDVIASSAFGVKVDSLAVPKNEFYLMGKEATDFTSTWKNLKFFGYFVFPRVLKFFKVTLFSMEVRNFFYGLINETIKTREEKNIVRPDMIHLLMEARKGKSKHDENGVIDTGFATVQEATIEKANGHKHVEITNEDIAAQAMIFFFAGFDSVTTLMCFMAYELAVHPEIQDKLREEIKETNVSCKGKLNYEALMKMKYMDMVVSESLRKWPNAVAVDRVCTKPYTIQPTLPDENPIHLEKGDVIWIPIFGFHRDPKYYPEPEKFDPERFNDENKGNVNPYAYLPFGVGPRNCIGSRFALLETKTLFYHLLLNFELVPTKKTPIPPKISKQGFNLGLEGGFILGLKPINN